MLISSKQIEPPNVTPAGPIDININGVRNIVASCVCRKLFFAGAIPALNENGDRANSD